MIYTCKVCGKSSNLISKTLRVCYDCIVNRWDNAYHHVIYAHKQTRKPLHLPVQPPNNGVLCNRCGNECSISKGGLGYCGMVQNNDGKLQRLSSAELGFLCYYYDPLPTNCVASWVCPAETGVGFPTYAYKDGPEYGYKNLAIFYHSCTFGCLFCQNYHFREFYLKGKMTAEELARHVNDKTACICYFGGDPASQIEHSIRSSEIAYERALKEGRILRICWETNGSMAEIYARRITEIALDSGGMIKFDIKAYNENVNIALTGVSNKRTLENFRIVSEYGFRRKTPPLLVVSTLLIPGYIDINEVKLIAEFIASIDRDIPYTLLGFYPTYRMEDMPNTSREHAKRCYDVAVKAGLNRVKLSNVHLLTVNDYIFK
ncbi:MAG: radical SAM protein [bacterium]